MGLVKCEGDYGTVSIGIDRFVGVLRGPRWEGDFREGVTKGVTKIDTESSSSKGLLQYWRR